ncbi:MAG: hypothetical protein ACRCVT_04125, partial [Leadbetterella sp.]
HSTNAKAKILHSLHMGSDPSESQEGVILLMRQLLETTNIQIEEIDAFEVGDSFAVNALAFQREFGISKEKINQMGGILAYGHPFGATGTINFIHLLAALQPKQKGWITLPGAGGQVSGMLIEKL